MAQYIVRCLLVVLCALSSFYAAAQQGVLQPAGVDNVVNLKLPPLALSEKNTTEGRIKEPFIAYNHKTSFSPKNSGQWKIDKTSRIWNLKIRSEGAHGIALVFSGVELRPGDKLWVYNEYGVSGIYSRSDIPSSGILPVPFLPGEEITVEYQTPIHAEPGTFVVEMVSHGYTDFFRKKNPLSRTTADGGDCYACVEGDSLQVAKRAVVKIVAHREGGSLLCTGTLINNTSGDGAPYLLTAQHCIGDEADANRSIFIFDYDDLCNQVQPVETRQLVGAQLLFSSFEHDLTLIKLYRVPPLSYRPYYAGWNLSSTAPGSVLSVHHARGDAKRVSSSTGNVVSASFDDGNPRAPNAFWKVKKWSTGITEGGSSGAPLLNSRHQVIGTLTGGSARCDYPYNDYFQKLSATVQDFHELKQWLDPAGSGVTSLNGLDPFEDINPSCYTFSNIETSEPVALEPYAGGDGYYSGYNSDQISSYAEKFFTTDTMMISHVSFSVGSINRDAAGGIVIGLHLPLANGLPDLPLYETSVPYSAVSEDRTTVEVYPYVKMKGTFFVSYTLSYSSQDTFAINQSAWTHNGSNTAYAKLATGWVPLAEISPTGAGASFDIQVGACEDIPPSPRSESFTITFYPNPANHAVVAKFAFTSHDEVDLRIYDLQGKQHNTAFQVADNNIIIDASTLPVGIYLVRIVTSGKAFTGKVVKR